MLSLCLLLLFSTAAFAQQPGGQELLSQADKVLQQMSEITSLPIKGPLKKKVMSRPEIQEYLTRNLHEEMTPEEIHAREALMRAFGLVSREFNLEKFLIGFYAEQAAGFYDPKTKTMFIADWIPPEMQSMTLSHELTHALQDQNWDMERYLRGARDDDDATNARQAVVEGYATAAMFQQIAGGMNLGQLPSLAPFMETGIRQQFEEFHAFASAPQFFRTEALFPYIQGMGFIQAGLQRGGWKDLMGLFEHPPATTKEIFEPQAYYNHQALPHVTLTHPPALERVPGLRFLSQNTMGELGYYSLLGQLVSEDAAAALRDAWLGDRYLLYERSGGDGYTLVARARWTSAETSLAFFRDYHTILAQKYPELATDKRSSADEFMASTANGVTILIRKGNECVWTEGVAAAQADAMLAWLRAL
jgi:hypothetical protein